MATEREQQVQEAARRAEAERAFAIQRTEQLEAAYTSGWEQVHAITRTIEPVLHELIARRVRAVVPDATAIWIEATDQGGPGWVLYAPKVRVPGGEVTDDLDELSDDHELSMYLSDLGEFMSSEDHPAQFFDLPAKA